MKKQGYRKLDLVVLIQAPHTDAAAYRVGSITQARVSINPNPPLSPILQCRASAATKRRTTFIHSLIDFPTPQLPQLAHNRPSLGPHGIML